MLVKAVRVVKKPPEPGRLRKPPYIVRWVSTRQERRAGFHTCPAKAGILLALTNEGILSIVQMLTNCESPDIIIDRYERSFERR